MADFKKERGKRRASSSRPDGVSVATLLEDASRVNASDEGRSQGSYLELPPESFVPDDTQPRKVFDEAALEELRVSIEAQGQIQPIVVRRTDEPGLYRIIAGERRWRAIKGSETVRTVKAILHIDSHEELRILLLQLEENNKREDVPLIDTANAFARVVSLSKNQKEAADKLTMSPGRLSKFLSVAKAPDDIKSLSSEGEVQDLDTLYALAKASEKDPGAVAGLVAKWKGGALNESLRKAAAALQKGAPANVTETERGDGASAQGGALDPGNGSGSSQPGSQSSRDTGRSGASAPRKTRLAVEVTWSIEGESYRGHLSLNREPTSAGKVWVNDGDTGREFELDVADVSLTAVVPVK